MKMQIDTLSESIYAQLITKNCDHQQNQHTNKNANICKKLSSIHKDSNVMFDNNPTEANQLSSPYLCTHTWRYRAEKDEFLFIYQLYSIYKNL